MKRFLALVSILALFCSLLLSSCSGSASAGRENREEELEESLQPVYEEMESHFSGSEGDYTLISEYLKSWAQKNELKVAKAEDHYIVLTNPATAGYKNKDTLTLQCSVEVDKLKNSLETLAIGMTALLGTQEHSKITLIVTESQSGEYIGASSLPAEYCKTDNFINITYSKDLALYTSGPNKMTSTMTSDIKRVSPQYSRAYAVTMSMSDYKDSFDSSTNYPNPIDVIGNLLAAQKSSGKLFQIASFKCDVTEGYMPKSATAVLVIDDNSIESFTSRFNSSYESMKEKFDKLEDSFVYTMTETSLPSSVMDNQSADNMISLMYTLKTGTYLQDEKSGEVIASSDFSDISTAGGKLKISVNARSLKKDVLSEMAGVFKTTAGLCDINYKSGTKLTSWSSEDTLGDFFRNALSLEDSSPAAVLDSTECEILASKVNKLNIISYNCNLSGTGKAALLNILHYEEELLSSGN